MYEYPNPRPAVQHSASQSKADHPAEKRHQDQRSSTAAKTLTSTRDRAPPSKAPPTKFKAPPAKGAPPRKAPPAAGPNGMHRYGCTTVAFSARRRPPTGSARAARMRCRSVGNGTAGVQSMGHWSTLERMPRSSWCTHGRLPLRWFNSREVVDGSPGVANAAYSGAMSGASRTR